MHRRDTASFLLFIRDFNRQQVRTGIQFLIKEHLGSNIRHYRIKSGFSQAKLAEMVDMATNYLGLEENGKKFPSSDMIERIAAALGKDTTDLFILTPIEQDWKETILSKISMLIDRELQTLRHK